MKMKKEMIFVKADTWRRIFFTACILVGSLSVYAQKQISGTVKDALGDPVAGANIVEKGTTNGVTTNPDGNFSLSVGNNAVLEISYIGYVKQEISVGSQTHINVTLLEDTQVLEEVVVTALGIRRQEKTLTYAQQQVSSEELLKVRDINFAAAMSGKMAGAEIKKSASGAGGSTKMLLRGNKSLSGSSSPLFVIDGVPMANNRRSYAGGMEAYDMGDGLSQINPDDIESITILKGSNAAAMYGSQGANGVVVITTKKGEEGKVTVNFNTGTTFETVTYLPELQFKYGSVNGAKESWSYDAGNYDDKFVKDFFDTGFSEINSFSVSGGTSKMTTFFSYGNVLSEGTSPTNRYLKHNFTLRESAKFLNDKLTLTSSIRVSAEKLHNRQPAQYYLNPLTAIYFFPRDRNINDFKEYQLWSEERNMYVQNWFVQDHHQSNPWWILNKQPRDEDTKRLIGNVALNYDFSEKLSLALRGNYDYTTRVYERKHAATSNATTTPTNGRYDYEESKDNVSYADAIMTYNDKFGDFSLNAVAGASYQRSVYGDGFTINTRSYGSGGGGSQNLLYPNIFEFQNLPTNQKFNSIFSSRLIKESLFASLTFGFRDMIYLDLSGRNDWASSLAGTGNESYFYPSFGLTLILNEMFSMPEAINFAKVRASHAIVGNEVPFNVVNPQHSINATNGISRNTVMPFTTMKPEMIKSTEFGIDLRTFDNRLGLDFTYYYINSQNQFISLPALAGSGYTSYYVNAGKIVNQGIEATLRIVPIKTSEWTWESAFNYSHNRNKVVRLHKDLQNPIGTGGTEGYESKFEAGGSISDIWVYKYLRDDAGRIILDDATGVPLKTQTTEKIGNLEPKWILGWNNTIDYKDFSLSFLISGKFGGVTFSQTESMLDGYGVSKRSAEARDRGYEIINAVRNGQAVTQIDPKLWYTSIGDRNGVGEAYVFDRTNVRLSQVALSYRLNFKKMGLPLDYATLSLIAQNLFFFVNKSPFDPELAFETSRNFQSYDNFNWPGSRSIGFNLNVTF
ncbi:MAG: SusC/RagA family TonB-linked outer membrane protein [Tannerella sp.]|jgi:TonB-linked SusC/RagA family outer membrane protein|nr:SusC/RagA family TonB-linked outer membrane protein [Tannerella sp.]